MNALANASKQLTSRASCSVPNLFTALRRGTATITLATAWIAHAQSAHFAGVETVVASSGLTNPVQVAADAAGDVFVLDAGSSRVLKEAPKTDGYQESVVTSSSMNAPKGIAVDSAGHVFVVDSGNNRILEETPSGNAYSESVMPISGLNAPTGVAADRAGNLYITDSGNNRIVEETLIGSNYSQTTVASGVTAGSVTVDAFGYLYIQILGAGQIERLIPSGGTLILAGVLSSSASVASDSSGTIYILDGGNSHIFRELPSGNLSYVQKNVINLGTTQLAGIAVDPNRNLYFCDATNRRVLKLSQSGTDFGSVAVGSTSSSVSLLFGFDAGSTIAAPSVVTQGISGLDYHDRGTGTCTTNGTEHAYASGDTCAVDVQFEPKGPGGRYGAAILYDNSGNQLAVGYVEGNGLSPQIHFNGTLSTLSLPGISSPTQIAADADGNLYIMNAVTAFSAANAVYKETWTGSGYIQSVIATNLAYPLNLALDGAGNVYVLDEGSYGIYRFSPTAAGNYIKTSFDTEYGNSYALGVDGFGNIYFANGNSAFQIDTPADGYYGNKVINVQSDVSGIATDYLGDIFLITSSAVQVERESPSEGGYVQTPITSNLGSSLLATDGVNNLYLAGGGIIEETPVGTTSYQQTLLSSQGATGVALDGNGNVYFSNKAAGTISKLDFSSPPALHFAATAIGSTSIDSPQTISLQNSGNAALNFPVPAGGVNPSLPSGFTMSDTQSDDCPVVSSAGASGILAAFTSCNLVISYSPVASTDLSNWMTVTDDNLNTAGPNYSTQSIALTVIGNPLTPTVNWSNPASIVYGTALGISQLSATSNVPGTFSYSPASETLLGVGSHALSVTFTPADTTAFNSVTTSVSITVIKANPVITWAAPAAVSYGTALSSTQLNASTPVSGTFAYSPSDGTVLSTGAQTLRLTFTPTDTVDYATVSASVPFTVNQASSVITWPSPVPITFGSSLDTTQLNAAANVPGTFDYSPAAGATPSAGTRTLSVTFTPTDTADYRSVTASVLLTVNQATPVITWHTPAPITYGTPLSSAQLDATSTLAGTFTYPIQSIGSILPAGEIVLTAQFTPQDQIDYTSVTATVTLTVSKATPTFSWATPAAIQYGTPLGSVQLNASGSAPGSVSYSPAPGSVLSAGAHTLTATLTPADSTDYTTVSQIVPLTVTQAPLTVKVDNQSVPYGSVPVLTGTVTGVIPGDGITASYTTTATVTSPLGNYPIAASLNDPGSKLSNYSVTILAAVLTITKATPKINWTTPAPITYGTALSSAQLDAATNAAGNFVYAPAQGTVLSAGTQTLSVSFIPTDAVDYSTATAAVNLVVRPATPTVSWSAPSSIVLGTPLSATQLNATASVPGTFSYSPMTGTVLPVGNNTLGVNFSPNDAVDYSAATASVNIGVLAPVPSITNIAPAFATAGAPGFSITILGTGFIPSSTAYWGNTALATNFMSGTQLTARVPASAIASPGISAIGVQSPAPGGGASNAIQFAVDSAPSSGDAPTINNTTATVTAGSSATYPVAAGSAATNISVNCLNLPAGTTCSYTNGTVVISTASSTPSGSYQVVLVFTETLPGTMAGIFLLPLLAPLSLSRRKRRSKWTGLAMFALALALLATATGCTGNAPSQTTKPSTQTVTSSVAVTLNVN